MVNGAPGLLAGPARPRKAKVTPPEPERNLVRPASLLRQVDAVLQRRITVLRASAGFGKTTMLADVSHRKQNDGILVGWLSLDEDDVPTLLVSYIACALEHGGLDLKIGQEFEAWSSLPIARQLEMLDRAIGLHAAPCLLVLDEVDRLPRASVALLDRLMKHAPRNLQVVMASRSDPDLDLATHFLDGSGRLVSTEQFRLTRTEIGRFLGGELSSRELNEIEERTAGWPIALALYRSGRASEADAGTDAETLTSNYIGVRVFRDLPKEVRSDLLELAVFDRIDADVVDEVLGSSDARVRVGKLSALDGLLLPVDGDGAVRRLHPLVRDYCVHALSSEDPARKRSLHARIALALNRRGHLAPAWRHASAAGDGSLVGELIESAGLFRMWLRDGVRGLVSADRFVTPEIAALFPRCALLRCVALRLALKFEEARALYESIRKATDGFSNDRDGGDAEGLAVDGVFVTTVLAGGSDRSRQDEVHKLLPAGGADTDGVVQARSRHTLLCVSCFARADFEESRRHGMKAKALLHGDTRYGNVFVDIYLGMAAMAQGRVVEATELYARARRDARRHFPSDPCIGVCAEVVALELDLEQNRERTIQQRILKGLPNLRGTCTDIYAVAVAVNADLMLVQYERESTVQFLAEALNDLEPIGAEHLSQYFSALLVFHLVEAERHEEASQMWRDRGLPSRVPALLDLRSRSWREMEATSCARIRLLAAQDEFAAAGSLALELCRTASEHGLTRTLLRGLALSMVVAHGAGEMDQAQARLIEFLQTAREVGYVRSLVRHRDVSRMLVRRLLDANPDPDTRAAAESLHSHLRESPKSAPSFTPRELEVLAALRSGHANRDIASRFGISEPGVRYHLRKIYRKMGVKGRVDAVRKARSLETLR